MNLFAGDEAEQRKRYSTADQQAKFDDIQAHAQAINDKLTDADATVNPPATPPAS